MSDFSWTALGLVMLGGAIGTLIRDSINRIVNATRSNQASVERLRNLMRHPNRDIQFWMQRFPLATMMVNVTGCLWIGWLAGIVGNPEIKWFWLAGICGGMTTFSTLQWESWELWREGHRRWMLLSLTLNYGLGLPAATFGWWLASW